MNKLSAITIVTKPVSTHLSTCRYMQVIFHVHFLPFCEVPSNPTSSPPPASDCPCSKHGHSASWFAANELPKRKRGETIQTYSNDLTKKRTQIKTEQLIPLPPLRFPFIQGTMPGLPVTSMTRSLRSQRACRSRAVCLPTRLSARAVTQLSMHCEILTPQLHLTCSNLLDTAQLCGYNMLSYVYVGCKPTNLDLDLLGMWACGIPWMIIWYHEIRVKKSSWSLCAEGTCVKAGWLVATKPKSMAPQKPEQDEQGQQSGLSPDSSEKSSVDGSSSSWMCWDLLLTAWNQRHNFEKISKFCACLCVCVSFRMRLGFRPERVQQYHGMSKLVTKVNFGQKLSGNSCCR